MAMGSKLVILAVAKLADAGGWTRYEEDVIGHAVGLTVRQVQSALADLASHRHTVIHSRGEGLFTARFISIRDRLSTGYAQAVRK
jgi:hypothetical protein